MLQFLLISVWCRKVLNQKLAQNEPMKSCKCVFWTPAASLQILSNIFCLDKSLCLIEWRKSSLCDQLCTVLNFLQTMSVLWKHVVLAGTSRIKVTHFGLQMNNLRTACWKPLALSYSQIWWWLVMCMSKGGQPFEAAHYQPSFSMSQITAQMLVEPHYHNANMSSRFKCGVCCWSKHTLKPLKNSIKECYAAHGCQNSTGSEFWGILSHLPWPKLAML